MKSNQKINDIDIVSKIIEDMLNVLTFHENYDFNDLSDVDNIDNDIDSYNNNNDSIIPIRLASFVNNIEDINDKDDNDKDNNDNDIDDNDNNSDIINNPKRWPNFPLLIKRSQRMIRSDLNEKEKRKLLNPLHIHRPVKSSSSLTSASVNYELFEIDSELFKGKTMMMINGLENSPRFLHGKNRSCNITIQGKFLKPIPFHNALVGQIFSQPLVTQPPGWLLDIFVPLINRLCPSMQLKVDGDNPFFLAPLMTSMQTVNAAKNGDEPNIQEYEKPIVEDLKLHGIDMSASERKNYLSNINNLERYCFDPNLVYTFDFYQHIFRFDSFKIKVGMINIDINTFIGRNHLKHQCIICPTSDISHLTKKNIDELQCIYDFDIIHDKCLNAANQHTGFNLFHW